MLFGGVACTPNEGGADDPTAKAEISLSQESAALTLEGGEVKVDITSNAAWTVEVSHDDVNITPASGSKNGAATITVPASTAPRTIEVKFIASKTYTDAALGLEGLPSTATAVLSISQNASGEIIEGGIASITSEGDHEIENAWVVAVATQGFVMSDATGSSILVYTGSGASIPAIGTVVSVSGKVVTYNGKLQFDKTATVTPSSQTVTVNNGTPTEISTYAALDELKNNMVVKYVEMKGKLECKMSSKGYMNYNIYVEDHNGYDDWKGSVYSPVAEIATKLEGWNGAYVIARGYSIYVSGTVYVNIIATDVEVDASKPVLNAGNIANVPAAGVQNATHNIVVAGIDNVTATPDGTIVTAASVAGNVLTYTVAANTGEARQGSITLSAEGVESVTIKVYQKTSGEEVAYNFMSDDALALTSNNDTRGYTCSTMVNGSEEVNGNGFKLGTGSYAGTFTSGELGKTGDATLEFYACAWTGKSAKLYIRLEGATDNLAVIDLAGNAGAANNEPYSITFADNEYHTVALTGLTATSKLQFSTSPAFDTAGDKATGRALVVGAHIK